MPSRRQFLSAASTLAATTLGQQFPLFAQTQSHLLPPYVADLNGDGVLDDKDRAILEHSLFAQRGYDIAPAAGYDHRADIFGRGVIDRDTVDTGLASLDLYAASGTTPQRPITVAWHYGWYNDLNRPPGW